MNTLEIQRFPREAQKNMGTERPREGVGNEPITATVIPQISGVQLCNTIRDLEWKDGIATLPGSNLRVNQSRLFFFVLRCVWAIFRSRTQLIYSIQVSLMNSYLPNIQSDDRYLPPKLLITQFWTYRGWLCTHTPAITFWVLGNYLIFMAGCISP